MAGGDIQLRDNGAAGGDIALADSVITTPTPAFGTWSVQAASGVAARLVSATVVTAVWTVPSAVGDAPVPHRLQEIASFVTFEATNDAKVMEVGLMVAHDARVPAPDAKVMEVGLMVVFLAPPPTPQGRWGMQGEVLHRMDMLQGGTLRYRRGQL